MDTNTSVEIVSTTPSETPLTSTPLADLDWASRLDAAVDAVNKETGATKYGKVDDAEKTRAEKQSDKTKKSDSSLKTSNKDKPVVEKVEDTSDTEVTEKEEAPKEDLTKQEEKPPANLTEKAAVKWGELRAEAAKAKELSKEVETLKAELEKAKSAPAVNEDVEKLKQINSEYEKELAVARVEATQEYKSNVVEPMVNVVGYLNSLASKYELNSRDMLAAFAEADSAKQSDLIADIAASMNERDRLKFYASADDYSEIIRRRDYYQTSSRERMSQIESEKQAEITKQQAESEKSVTEAKAAYEKATSKVFEDLKKSVPVLSDEEIASDVQRLAKGDYSNANPELKAYLAHSGALLPHLLKSLKEAQANLEKANNTIAGYRNGSPKAGRGSTDATKSMPENVGFLEALEQQLG